MTHPTLDTGHATRRSGRRPTIRRALVAAATAAGLLLGSSPASAACPATWATRLPCAAGDITDRWVGEDGLTWISGWIDPCGTPRASERFGFVYYIDGPEPQGYVFPERLRAYGPGRTTFEGAIDPSVEEVNGPLLGVCLAYGAGRVVDCVQPIEPPADGLTRPLLPPIREIARLPVRLETPGGTDPNCATCV